MNLDIWHVAIPVRNLELSVKFYTEELGLELLGFHVEGGRRQAFVRLKERVFTIELFEPVETDEHTLSAKPHHLAFECSDLEAFRRDLFMRGSINDLPEVTSFNNGVKYLRVKDPDGVPLEFFEGRSIFDQSIAHTRSRQF